MANAVANYFGLAIFLLVGVGFIYVAISTMSLASQEQTWPSVNGTILSSNVTSQTVYHPNPNGQAGGYYETEYSPSVTYTYTVNGQSLIGRAVNQFGFSSGSESVAGQEANKYLVGSTHSVYYNPSNPSRHS